MKNNMEYVVLFLVINLLQVKFNSILRSAAWNLTINEGCFQFTLWSFLFSNKIPLTNIYLQYFFKIVFGFSFACYQIIFSPWTGGQLFVIKFDFLNLRKHSWKTFCPPQNFFFLPTFCYIYQHLVLLKTNWNSNQVERLWSCIIYA